MSTQSINKHLVFVITVVCILCYLAHCKGGRKTDVPSDAIRAKTKLETNYVHKTVNVRSGRGLQYRVIGKLNVRETYLVDSIVDQWALVCNIDGSKLGYAYGPLLKERPAPDPTSTMAKNQSSKSRQPFRRRDNSSFGNNSSIRGTDNGYKWNKTAETAKKSICKDLAKRIGTGDAQFYYGCLEEMYDTTEPMLLEMTIAEVAALCSVW